MSSLVIVMVHDGDHALAKPRAHVRKACIVVHQSQSKPTRSAPERSSLCGRLIQVEQISGCSRFIKGKSDVAKGETRILPEPKVASRKGNNGQPERPPVVPFAPFALCARCVIVPFVRATNRLQVCHGNG